MFTRKSMRLQYHEVRSDIKKNQIFLDVMFSPTDKTKFLLSIDFCYDI